MTLGIMQPYFFPYIGYFQHISSVDKFVFLDDVNFIKKGWINRNYIQQKGTKILFTIPLVNASQNVKINELKISYDQAWNEKLLTTIEHAYKKAPQYNQRIEAISQVILTKYENIGELAKSSIISTCNLAEINADFIDSSSSIAIESAGSERIKNICKHFKATNYINPIGGLELYDKNYFTEHDITLNFIRTKEITYKQNSSVFTPNLSIIDVLMYNTNEEIQHLLTNYELI